MNLLEGDSDSEVKLTINKDYAKRYDIWRRGEELQKLKDKYGDNVKSEESSSSEEEDEDAKELSEEIEKNFFKTLSCLKEKNPKIYDKNVRFFDRKQEEKVKENGIEKKAGPSISLGEYHRKVLLEKEGKFSDDDDEEKSFEGLTNAELEKSLKKSFSDVLKNSESEDENDNWGGLFKKRLKTEKELKAEEDDYKLWLAGEKERLKNEKEAQDLKGLHDFWTDPKLDEGERFLRDYILNKRFLDKNDSIPTYDEVDQDSDSGLSEDENILEQQDEFERKYNFRFEEPDKEFIKRYPRTMELSMRKKDDRRKKRREEVRARKEEEKIKKTEELKRLKSLKRKEIMDKIKKLQEITGNENMGFQNNDLEDDFDPEKHDKRMSELFNDDYYGACEDEEKPEDPELDKELEIENWDEWGTAGGETEELHCEDPGFNMDCDYNPSQDRKFQNDLIQLTKKRKKRRKSKFAEAVAKEKPIFDPRDKTFEKYVDEYYSLDYEDLIGDLPCRFKYRKTIPNDFGLSVEEILAAPDKELNRWVSIKRIVGRKPDSVELNDVKTFKDRSNNLKKKRKYLPSLYGPQSETAELETPSMNPISDKELNKQAALGMKKKNQDWEKKKNQDWEKKKNKEINSGECQISSDKKQKNKNKKFPKQMKNKFADTVCDLTDSRLKSYGINPNRYKRKLIYGKNKN